MITKEGAKKFANFCKNHPNLTLPEIAERRNIKFSTADRYARACVNEYELLPQKPPLDQEEEKDTPTKNKVEIEREGNKAEVTSRSDRIKTLEQLIEEANIDLDTWEIERHVINKWDGQLKGGNPVPLWQVKAWLEKKVLTEKEFEPIKPVSLDYSYDPPSKPETNGLHKGVLIPDPHIGYRRESYSREMIPFHDRRCLDIDLQVIKDIEPDTIVILGDFLDMPNWSKKFIRSPEFANILQAAAKEGHWWLRNMREIAPDAEIYYIQGNHEERLPRFLKSNTKAAYGVKPATATKEDPDLVSVERILDLQSLQINWIGDYPDGGRWINDNLVAEHGSTTSSVSGKSAGKVLDDARESHVFGHVHRVESATKTAYPKNGPKVYRATSLGCQVYLDDQGTEAPGSKKKQDWQNALGVVEYEPGNGYFSVHPSLIYNGEMIYNGKKYKGDTRLNDSINQAELEKYNFVDNR